MMMTTITTRCFGVTTRMIHALSDLDGVHPDPFLRFVMPDGFEALLADGTANVSQAAIGGDRNPLLHRALRLAVGGGGRRR